MANRPRWTALVAVAWYASGGFSLAAPTDEELVQTHIKALRSEDSKTRADAASELRRIVAKHPSGTVYLALKDGGEAAWREKVAKVTPGMPKDEVRKILPEFAEGYDGMEIADGDSHFVVYQLDYHWSVTATYRNTGETINPPVLKRRAVRYFVPPPKDYTGTWTMWYVNGQKGYEIEYKAGKYDGVFTSFHDNGNKSYEQHYVNHVAHGADTGWFPDGKKMYTGTYREGKQDGTWTHWSADGTIQNMSTFSSGERDSDDKRPSKEP